MNYSRRRHRFRYTIDVLTDGSEDTGDGTLFLSVLKRPATKSGPTGASSKATNGGCGDDREKAEHEIAFDTDEAVARYAINGLGDATSRLAADQRFKLHPTRAIFDTSPASANCSSKGTVYSPSCSCRLSGLPSLLIALHQAGSAELVVTSVHERLVEQTVQLLHKHHQYPQVKICNVPWIEEEDRIATESFQERKKESDDLSAVSWWKVYQDEFVLVHAHQLAARGGGMGGIVYLYTLLQHEPNPSSVLVLPPFASLSSPAADLTRNIPEAVVNYPIICGLALNASPFFATTNLRATATNSFPWYFTKPLDDSVVDSRILVRAQHQSNSWNARDPVHFPWNHTCASNVLSTEPSIGYRLCTGSSLVLRHESFVVVDRMSSICRHLQVYKVGDDCIEKERASWPSRYTFDLPSEQLQVTPSDDNEIDLSDADDVSKSSLQSGMAREGENDAHSSDSKSSVDLVCFGTGCAAPSPYRGASGYAIILDTSNVFVFEVGEGFLAQWNRYCSEQSLLSIRVIWISHAQ